MTTRITLYLYALNGRGIASAVSAIAEATAALGVETTLVADSVQPGVDQPAGVEVVSLGEPAKALAAAALRRALRRLHPDVLYAHGNGPARTAVLATRGLRTRPSLVTVEHNHYSSYTWRLPRVRRAVNAAVLPRADALVGVSPGVSEDLMETFPAVAGRVVTIPPPLTRWDAVDALAAEPVDHPWFAEETPVVVTVGHVHDRKDHRTLVKAVAHARDVLARPVRLAIIGGISDAALHERLLQLAVEHGLEGDVEFLGREANPLRYVARAGAFALTSRNEGMPLVLLEALAVGTPVVSTDCPSGPEWLLGGGAAGVLAPVGDHVSVGAGLARVLSDEPLRERLVAAGRARVADFSPERIARAYLDLAGR